MPVRYLSVCLFFAFLLPVAAEAQSFFPENGPLLESQIDLQQANIRYIFFDNPGGDSLLLRWKKLEVSQPAGWDTDLCDYGHCYIGIPSNALMNVVYDTIRPYIKLIVQPGAIAGSAWFAFRVLEIGQEDNFQDVYFSVYTPGVTSANAPVPSKVNIYPNPAHTFIMLENLDAEACPLTLYAPQGNIVLESTLQPNSRQSLNLPPLPAGLYRLQCGAIVHNLLIF